jgi:hypothetical protein
VELPGAPENAAFLYAPQGRGIYVAPMRNGKTVR